MWWLYFDTSAAVASHTISASRDPGKLARLAYTYVHLFLVAGIIVAAVADEFVLAHPLSPTEPRTTVVVLGGTALYLVGDALFKWAIAGRLPIPPIVGVLLLGPLIPVSAAMSSLALMALATLVIVAVALWEARARTVLPRASIAREGARAASTAHTPVNGGELGESGAHAMRGTTTETHDTPGPSPCDRRT
jgi:low temperature requirement protein LtrA